MSGIQLPPDPYKALDLQQDADIEAIKKAHRKSVLRYHPDRVTDPNLMREASRKFQQTQQAYAILSDPDRRRRYHDQVKLDNEMKQAAQEQQEMRPKSDKQARQVNTSKIPPSKAARDKCYGSPHTEATGNDPKMDAKRGARPRQTRKKSPTVINQGQSKNEGLRGFINGHSVVAHADTGADGNFIAQDLAESLDLQIIASYQDDRGPTFLMAHGKAIRPVARATATWVFAKSGAQKYQLEFLVLPNCIFDVMLGAEFVYGTGLLGVNRNLFTDLVRPKGAVHIRRVKACGDPQQRLGGYMQRFPTTMLWKPTSNDQVGVCSALPDSAAEPNIVSWKCALRHRWLSALERNPPNHKLLQFADGSTAESQGRIRLYWTFASQREFRFGTMYQPKFRPRVEPTPPTEQTCFFFDVLFDCPWDVIVGQDFLDSTEAFTQMAEDFRGAAKDTPLSLNPVLWIPKRSDTPVNPTGPEAKLVAQLTARRLQEDEEKRKQRKARYASTIQPQGNMSSSVSVTTVSTGSSTPSLVVVSSPVP